ncbi:MAG TPA: IS110 family transposase [Thermoguttaceae bacterium]
MSHTTSTPSFVGIDVSSGTLDVCSIPEKQLWTVGNDPAGHAALVDELRTLKVVLIVLEATGGYEIAVTAELAAAGLPVAVVNPRQVRDFAKALGITAKTDRLDAGVLARFAQNIRPEIRPLPTEEERFLRELLTRRRQLVQLQTQESNRFQQAASAKVRHSISNVLQFLEKQRRQIDADIDRLIRQSSVWREKEELLRSVPGVGPTTARTLLAELPELGRYGNRQISSLAGLAPRNRDSGKFRGRRSIGGGRGNVRKALYMAALTAVKYNPSLHEFYQRLRNEGKKFKVAITACMHKLLIILNTMMRKNTPWNSKFNPQIT